MMHEHNARQRKVFQILKTIVLFTLFLRSSASKGCREQLQNEIVAASECETICRRITSKNNTRLVCELRLLVILPNQPWQYEASLTRVTNTFLCFTQL